LPEDKLKEIKDCKPKENCSHMGDGINDAQLWRKPMNYDGN
jgi:cation transport ATPase